MGYVLHHHPPKYENRCNQSGESSGTTLVCKECVLDFASGTMHTARHTPGCLRSCKHIDPLSRRSKGGGGEGLQSLLTAGQELKKKIPIFCLDALPLRYNTEDFGSVIKQRQTKIKFCWPSPPPSCLLQGNSIHSGEKTEMIEFEIKPDKRSMPLNTRY